MLKKVRVEGRLTRLESEMEARGFRLRACEQRLDRYSQRSRGTGEEITSSKHDLRSVRQRVDQIHEDMTNWTN
eukprot:2513229-Pyramimonas_sp.AAC.1